MDSEDIIVKAAKFAEMAHEGQTRKYTNEPYIKHCLRVAARVLLVTDDEKSVAAALLHDVIEDTQYDFATLEKEFGLEVAFIVDELTDRQTPEDGLREFRKKRYAHHIGQSSKEAQTIKFADIIDNVPSIVWNDPKFGEVYLREKMEIMTVAHRGDKGLKKEAQAVIDQGFSRLFVVARENSK